MRIGMFPVQTPLRVQLGLGTQLCHKAPGDLQVKIVENTVNKIALVRLSSREWPKAGHGTAKLIHYSYYYNFMKPRKYMLARYYFLGDMLNINITYIFDCVFTFYVTKLICWCKLKSILKNIFWNFRSKLWM